MANSTEFLTGLSVEEPEAPTDSLIPVSLQQHVRDQFANDCLCRRIANAWTAHTR